MNVLDNLKNEFARLNGEIERLTAELANSKGLFALLEQTHKYEIEWHEKTKQELTELQAKYDRMEDEWYPPNHMDAVEERTIVPLRKMNALLTAQVAVMGELLDEAKEHLHHSRCLDDDALKCPECSLESRIDSALATAPQSVTDLLAVLEAAKGHYNSWLEMSYESDSDRGRFETHLSVCGICTAVRKWAGEKP